MPTAHDEVSRKGVAQDVAGLPLGWLDRGFEQHLTETPQCITTVPIQVATTQSEPNRADCSEEGGNVWEAVRAMQRPN